MVQPGSGEASASQPCGDAADVHTDAPQVPAQQEQQQGQLVQQQQQQQQQQARGPSCRKGPVSQGLVDSLEAALLMAQRALVVRREALNTLLDEVVALRSENELLAAAVQDPGLEALRQRLQYLEAELAEERSAREAVERELADTAEATYEMWDAFRDWMGSESRAGTSLHSRDSSPPEEGRSAGWRTPPLRRGGTPVNLSSPALSWQAANSSWRSATSASPPPGDVGEGLGLGVGVGEAGSPHGVGVGLRVEVPGPGEAAAMERRVKALAGKLQQKDLRRGRGVDVDVARDRGAGEAHNN